MNGPLPRFAGARAPMVILEIGGNHEGDFAYASKLVEMACLSKAGVVKLQIYSADGLVNPKFDENRHRHFQKFELSADQYRQLLSQIRGAGKLSCASVWSENLYNELADDIDILKVGSGDLTNYLLTDTFLRSGKPVVFSTGLARLDEVEAVVSRCRSILGSQWAASVALLQCTTSYPCPPEFLNLDVITDYQQRFECAIGYSDHYEGHLAAEVAFDLGAQLFEFHFTDNRQGKVFRDHKISWTNAEVDAFVERMELVQRMMGTREKRLTSHEAQQNYQREFRKGLYYAMGLKKGHMLKREDLVSLRPAAEHDPSTYESFVGRVIEQDVTALEPVSQADF